MDDIVLTITDAGRSATISGEALQGEQLALPFSLDRTKLSEFLTRWLAIEDEEDRLREDKRQLKEDYAPAFPMRGVLTAVKRIRAMQKLEAHPTEGMKREHLSVLEYLIERHLLDMRQELVDILPGMNAEDSGIQTQDAPDGV